MATYGIFSLALCPKVPRDPGLSFDFSTSAILVQALTATLSNPVFFSFWCKHRPGLCEIWRLFLLNLTQKLKRKMGAFQWQKDNFNMAYVMQMI
jgi:hypothetical protein